MDQHDPAKRKKGQVVTEFWLRITILALQLGCALAEAAPLLIR